MLERLNSLNARERMGLLAVAIVLFVLVIDNLIYRPLALRCENYDRQIKADMENMAIDQQVVAMAPQVENQYGTIRELLGDPLDPAEAIDEMKGEIDRIAKESNVLLRSIKHLNPRETDAYMVYTVDIGGFESDEESLIRFLYALRSYGGGTFRVTRMSITPNDTGAAIKGALLITKVAASPAAFEG